MSGVHSTWLKHALVHPSVGCYPDIVTRARNCHI